MENNMKKTILAASLAVALLSGCMTTSDPVTVAELNVRAEAVQSLQYEKSAVSGLEQVRLPINSLFNQSVPILNDYIAGQEAFAEGSQLQASLSFAETEEERLAMLEEYKNSEDAAKKSMHDDYIAMINDDHMESIYKRIGVVSLEIAAQALLFAQMDQVALWTDIDFSEIMNEKDKLAVTLDQLDILNDSFTTLNDEQNNNKAAGLIK
jgi:hypothetical protein